MLNVGRCVGLGLGLGWLQIGGCGSYCMYNTCTCTCTEYVLKRGNMEYGIERNGLSGLCWGELNLGSFIFLSYTFFTVRVI